MFSSSMAPVPLAVSFKFAFETVEYNSLPETASCDPVKLPAYNSVKFASAFWKADLRSSPVPSFATDPTFKFCCAILYRL